MSIQVQGPGQPRPSESTGIISLPARQEEEQKTAALNLAAVPQDRVETTPMRPPSEVLEEMQRASERFDELRGQQRELHFAADPHTNRVIVQVRDLDGNILKTIPPSKALEIISGGPLD